VSRCTSRFSRCAINCRCSNGPDRDGCAWRKRIDGSGPGCHARGPVPVGERHVIVKPETVIARHRQGFRVCWTWKSRRRIGRPPVAADVRARIRTVAQENPLWGAPRIHGELLKLGLEASQATVAKYMPRRPTPPSQTWRTFLANHVQQIAAADFFVVPTATCRLLFVLVLLAHERRRVVHIAATAHPTAASTAQQLREAFPSVRERSPWRCRRCFTMPRGNGCPVPDT
jgi:hypothetical protein